MAFLFTEYLIFELFFKELLVTLWHKTKNVFTCSCWIKQSIKITRPVKFVIHNLRIVYKNFESQTNPEQKSNEFFLLFTNNQKKRESHMFLRQHHIQARRPRQQNPVCLRKRMSLGQMLGRKPSDHRR